MAKSDREHATQLLDMAGKDYTALSNMLDPSDFAEEIFGFHAQQAIEKSLKAWVAALSLTYPKSHDISELIRILEKSGADLDRFPKLESYSAFAVQYRYEALEGSDKPLNRTAVLDMASGLMAHVRQIIVER
jgi:HEPN domain-containing protein